MFKALITLAKGRVFATGERLADQNALVILDQQMRDASAAVDRAKKALAVAIAQDKQEEQRLAATRRQIADLEQRAISALAAGRDDLAQKAAEAIAGLETDANAAQTARDIFAVEIAKLERHVGKQSTRLADLDRGRRIARAAQAVRIARQGRVETACGFQNTLMEAEATLARLRAQQTEADAAEEALDTLEAAPASETIAEKMAAEGFGPPIEARPADILARLKARAGTA
ncbi:MAG: PspA/IM30 family protein [Methylocella sp.]